VKQNKEYEKMKVSKTKSELHYVIYDTEVQSIYYGEMDPEPWTQERFCAERAFYRSGEYPLVLGLDRDGLIATIESLGVVLALLGATEAERDYIHELLDHGAGEAINDKLDELVDKHVERVKVQLERDEQLKMLDTLSNVAIAASKNPEFATAISGYFNKDAIQLLLESVK
jgi:hypothetical protein